LQNEGYKKFTFYAGYLFIVIAIINIFVQDFSKESQVFTYCLGALNLIICGILYFNNRRVNSKAPFGKDDILSYLSLGLILFYIGYLPIKITRYFFALNNISESPYVRPVHLSLIILMYVIFIIGFLRMRRMPAIQEKNNLI
jgi:intracellular septation protein A